MGYTAFTKSSARQEHNGPMIRKRHNGYHVVSEKGRNLGGPYRTHREAENRLRQVEYFKHQDEVEKRMATLF
jgi:hypothetical protein